MPIGPDPTVTYRNRKEREAATESQIAQRAARCHTNQVFSSPHSWGYDRRYGTERSRSPDLFEKKLHKINSISKQQFSNSFMMDTNQVHRRQSLYKPKNDIKNPDVGLLNASRVAKHYNNRFDGVSTPRTFRGYSNATSRTAVGRDYTRTGSPDRLRPQSTNRRAIPSPGGFDHQRSNSFSRVNQYKDRVTTGSIPLLKNHQQRGSVLGDRSRSGWRMQPTDNDDFSRRALVTPQPMGR